MAVYGGWREVPTLEDVEEQGRLVDRHAKRPPGMADRSDAAIARELLKMVRWSTEHHGGPQTIHGSEYPSNRVARCMQRGCTSGGD